VRHLVSTSLLLVVTWLLWSGHSEPLMLILGAASVVTVLAICWRMGTLDEEGSLSSISWRLLTYLPWLTLKILIANWNVARRILRGSGSIQPQLITTEARQVSEIGLVIYANSVTLTPGTITVDIQGRGLLIHALSDAAAAGIAEGAINRRVAFLEKSG